MIYKIEHVVLKIWKIEGIKLKVEYWGFGTESIRLNVTDGIDWITLLKVLDWIVQDGSNKGWRCEIENILVSTSLAKKSRVFCQEKETV